MTVIDLVDNTRLVKSRKANILPIKSIWCFINLTEVDNRNNWFKDVIVGWLVAVRINVDLAIFQPYLDLEAGDNQSLKIQVARPGIEPRSSCSASQELNHPATAAPCYCW